MIYEFIYLLITFKKKDCNQFTTTPGTDFNQPTTAFAVMEKYLRKRV